MTLTVTAKKGKTRIINGMKTVENHCTTLTSRHSNQTGSGVREVVTMERWEVGACHDRTM